MNILNTIIRTASAFVLQIKSRGFTRIDDSMHAMLRELTSLFGEGIWEKMIINIG